MLAVCDVTVEYTNKHTTACARLGEGNKVHGLSTKALEGRGADSIWGLVEAP